MILYGKALTPGIIGRKMCLVLQIVLKTLPDYATTLNAKTPDALFYSFLYKYKVVDRYSWIELNGSIQRSASLSAAVTKSNGLDYSLFGTGNGGVVGVVNYVTPNSSAAAAGIQRGDAIIEVNGATLSTSNYTTLQSDSYSITFQKCRKKCK